MEAQTIPKKTTTLVSVEQSLMNKKVSLPANEIVTKEYTPDTKPIMKLITKDDMQKSQQNISYIPPKVKNAEYEKYGQNFYPADFLGYKYAQEFDQMVYFRYNNEQFNELHQSNSSQQRAARYFGGLFIPLNALQSKQFKAQDNMYSALNLTVPEIKDSVTQSFAKNSKGCSFDPLFSSNFTSGNMMAAIRKKPFQYDIILQQDTNCKAAEWFNFAVKFIEEGNYTFNIVNMSNENPLYTSGMKVPYYSYFQQSMKTESLETIKSGNGWTFGGKNITFTKTDTRKEKQLMDQTYYCLSFQYKCKNRQDTVIFASSIPYTSIDYERFLNRVLYSRIGQHMKMEKIEICQTLAGNSLSAYVFYHRKSKSNTLLLKSISQQKLLDSRPHQRYKTINLNSQSSASILSPIGENTSITKSIVFLARQHSGETSSSFVLQGVVDFLMDNTEFDVFKKNFQFVVIPFVNPDGVKYGNQRVNLAGADLDKCWRNPNEVFEPEVYHVKKWLKSMNQLHPISLLINLSTNTQSLSTNFKSVSVKKYCQQVPQLFPYIISKRVPQVSFQQSQFTLLPKHSLVSSLGQIFPKALVYDFATSMYGWKIQNNVAKKTTESVSLSISEKDDMIEVNEFTPDIYRSIGKELITTYLEYVRLCERNIGIQDRWLREIDELPDNLHFVGKQPNMDEKKYELSWQRDLIRFDYSLFTFPKPQTQTNQGRKHKTIQYRFSGGNLQQAKRSRQKKLTMPFLRNNSPIPKDQKQNAQKSSLMSASDPIDATKPNSSMDSILGQLRKSSSLASSIFTPKRRSQLLKQISESIKQSPLQKDSSFTIDQHKSSTNLLGIIEKKQKKLSGMTLQLKNLAQMTDKIQFNPKDNNKTGVSDAFVKFQSMKRPIPILGIKNDNKSFGSGRI